MQEMFDTIEVKAYHENCFLWLPGAKHDNYELIYQIPLEKANMSSIGYLDNLL